MDIINREECRKRLHDIYIESFRNFGDANEISTDLRRATAYLDMKEFL
jgi:hypothetical protein